MLTLQRISQFKKDYKRCVKRGYDIEQLHTAIEVLAKGKKLDSKYRDHSLLGDYRDCRECHIEPDWLVIYHLTEYELILIRTGTHTDLFE
jgi:mRNA interferase YafQ